MGLRSEHNEVEMENFEMNHTHADSCCKQNKVEQHETQTVSSLKAAIHATVHCLTGCMIGEFIGLSFGVTMGLAPMTTMFLSTVLAFISGFSLTVFPLMRNARLDFHSAMKAVWLGELLSIGIMELVMNSVDYHMGGVSAGSVANPLFWKALAIAVPAGFIAALPVNAFLIAKQMKKCH